MAPQGRPEPPEDVVRRVGAVAARLPEAYAEEAWTGTRWRIRQRTFAHVLVLNPRRATDWVGAPEDGALVLTFRSGGDELLALTHAGWPFLKPPWAPTVLALVIDDDTDWDEVAELVVESYRLLAPQKLARLLDG